MIGLFDRDVFIKLCCCSLLDETIRVLGITKAYRLASTQNEKSNRKIVSRKLKREAVEDALRRVMDGVAAVPVIPAEMVDGLQATEEFCSLGDCDGIDAGEQILAAIVWRGSDESFLISGDKRFMKSLRESKPAAWEEVEKSLITFERCLLAVIDFYGFETVSERILEAKDCDGALKIACGGSFTKESFTEALLSFSSCSC